MSSVDRLLRALAAVAVLLFCGACNQHWKFARTEYPMHGVDTLSLAEAMPAGSAVVPAGATQPDVMSHQGDHFAEHPACDPPPPASDCRPQHARCDSGGITARLRSMWREGIYNVANDHGHYYSWPGMRDLWIGVGLAAPFANTSLDSDFQNWYQRDVRSSDSDNFAAFCKTFGEGKIFIPAFAGLGLVGGFFEDRPLIGAAGDFGDRVTRSYLVGGPPMILMQFVLGGSRPDETSVRSQWKPFDDTNAVSGHAFMGAVPFITAANMVENPWAKSALLICSTFTAWSRVNDDRHYTSQAVLGWWMAYLACRAVDDTQREDRRVTFAPLVTPEMAGIGVVARR